MTNNHPDQIDTEIDRIIEGCHDYIRGLRTDHLIGISKKEAHAAVKVLVLGERKSELLEIKKLANYSLQYHDYQHVMFEIENWVDKRLIEIKNLEGEIKRVTAQHQQPEGRGEV